MKLAQLIRSWRSAVPGPDAPIVLVTNDDGFDAPGLWQLVQAVAPSCRVVVCAPDRPQSWAGRSHRSDRGPGIGVDIIEASPLVPVPLLEGCYRVSGTPALCVRAALDALGVVPALVVSGVNDDHNTGSVATASGTLGAAWEAAGSGLPAMAFSASSATDQASSEWIPDHIHALVMRALRDGLPADAAIATVNLPSRLDHLTRWEVCFTDPRSPYSHQGVQDAEGRWSFPAQESKSGEADLGTDEHALAQGRISVTFWPRSIGLDSPTWQ